MLEQPVTVNVTSHDCWPGSARVLREEALNIPSQIRERLECLAEEISKELNLALSMERKFGEQNDKTMYLAPFFAKVVREAAPEVELEQLPYYPLAMDPCFAGDPLLDLLPQYGHATALMCTPIPLNNGSSTNHTNSSPIAVSVEMFKHSERGSSTNYDSKGSSNDDSTSDDDLGSCESSDDVQHTDHSSCRSSTNSQSEGTHDEGSASEGDLEGSETSAAIQHKKDYPNWDVDAREYFSGEHLEDGTEWSFYHDPRGASANDTLHPRSGVLDHRLLARLTLDLEEETTPLALTCLALESEVYSVMSSALFQRRAWGILGPMRGVVFDRMSTTVRIVLGWLEETNDLCGSIVHVLHEATGAYDLSHPEAAINFAILIGGEARRFALDRSRASQHYPHLLQDLSERSLKLWRVDQKGLASKFKHAEEVPASSRFQRWLISTDPLGPMAPYENINGLSHQSLAHSPMMPGPYASSNAPPTPSLGSATPKKASHISASTLAAGGRHHDKSLLIRYFMFDRLATTRTLPFFPMLSDSKCQIDSEFASICKVYYELTSFAWLSDTAKSRLSADTRKSSIVRHAEWALEGFQSLANIGRFPGVKTLSGVCSQILVSNMRKIEDVLQSVLLLRGKGWKQAKELECRIHFDRLLMLLFHGTADRTSDEPSKEDYVNRPHVMVSLERSLSLPRGEVSEAISPPQEEMYIIYETIDTVARESTSIRASDRTGLFNFSRRLKSKPALISFNPSIVPIHDPGTLHSPEIRSTSQTPDAAKADTTLRRLYAENCAQLTLQKDMESLARYLENVQTAEAGFYFDTRRNPSSMVNNYDNEPGRAVCDSVGYLRIPSIFSSIAASKAFNIILPPTPSPRHSGRTTSSPDAPPHANGLFGIRQGQMVRTFDPENSADIQATAQSQAIAVHALFEDLKQIPVTDDKSAGGIEVAYTDSLHLPVETDGTSLHQGEVLDMRRDLFLPLITTANKKAQGTATGVDQGRMYAIASTKFYAALGISGMPVYTIITEGPIAVITVTYGEEWLDHPFDQKKYEVSNDSTPEVGKEDDHPQPAPKPTKVHIIERNVVSYDISKPLGILNFATFLIKLRFEHTPQILEKLGDVEDIKKRLQERGIPLKGNHPKASWRNTRTVVAK